MSLENIPDGSLSMDMSVTGGSLRDFCFQGERSFGYQDFAWQQPLSDDPLIRHFCSELDRADGEKVVPFLDKNDFLPIEGLNGFFGNSDDFFIRMLIFYNPLDIHVGL